MTVTLESLELTAEEMDASKEAVQKMAYFKWLDAGCPDGGQLEFWLYAEREWIGHNYVPHRARESACQQQVDQTEAVAVGQDLQQSDLAKSRQRHRARVKVSLSTGLSNSASGDEIDVP